MVVLELVLVKLVLVEVEQQVLVEGLLLMVGELAFLEYVCPRQFQDALHEPMTLGLLGHLLCQIDQALPNCKSHFLI